MTAERDAAERALFRAVRRDPLLDELSSAARAAGWSVHVVGGWVRDRLLRRPSRDVDLILGPASSDALTWLSDRSSHRVVTFERRVVNHRLTIAGRIVDLVDRGSRPLDDELSRRDFTVNALAIDLCEGALVDPTGGLADLDAGRLALPRDDAYRRDPLRMLRGVRLSHEIPRLALGKQARRLAKQESRSIRGAAAERVSEELDRMLATGSASAAIATCDELGLLEPWIPEIAATKGCTQNRYHHLDVWQHTLAALLAADRPSRLTRGLLPGGWPDGERAEDGPLRPPGEESLAVLRWSLLLHDLGKPETRRVGDSGQASFHGHDVVGERIAGAVCRRLAASRQRARAVQLIVRQHLRLVVPPHGVLSDRALLRIVRALGPWTEVLALHALADQVASRGIGWRRTRTRLRRTVARLLALEREHVARQRKGRLISGRDVLERLGLAPGPRVGRILERAEELRDAGQLTSREQALDWLATVAAEVDPD